MRLLFARVATNNSAASLALAAHHPQEACQGISNGSPFGRTAADFVSDFGSRSPTRAAEWTSVEMMIDAIIGDCLSALQERPHG